MSRFFRSSDTESESSSSEDDIVAKVPVSSKVFQFSDDEEETKRVVRSAKDKRYDELKNIIKQLKNHKKIKDMSNVLSDFEDLGKAFDKARKVVDKEGIPRFYIRCLVELEDFVNECWEDREGRKQMSKNNSKGLAALRQKLRKYLRDFEKQVQDYRENPMEGDEDDDEEKEEDEADASDFDSDDEGGPVSFLKKSEPKENKQDGMGSDDDDSSISWGSDSTVSSESEEEGETREYDASMFLKKQPGDTSKKEAIKKIHKRDKKKTKMDRDADDDEGEWTQVTTGAPMTVEKPKMFAKDTEVNHDAVTKKLKEIVSARGKKGTDRNEQIALLKELLSIANANNLGPATAVKIMFNIMAAIFDYNPNIATCMRSDMWETCLVSLKELIDALVEYKEVTANVHILEENESIATQPYRVRGCILAVTERTTEEFTKMLQACDAHSTEYVDRLKDEKMICDLIEELQNYMEGRTTTGTEEMCRVYLKRIEYLYYKFDYLTDSTTEGEKTETSEEIMERLCKFIYTKDSSDRLRTRGILCHIYHHAMHDRWYQARDLMLMSHLQDNIQHSDVPTQILYNRTMVQLGLCAFRQGMIKDAHNALVDIQSGGRAKELLAQGLLLQRQHERTPEQEKIEKRRLLPYHMHINLELLECVYLVSAMLIEIPYMAAHEMDARRRMISKNFHHVLRMSERQTLTGPPESMREHVVAASKAMKTGDWRACKQFIVNEKMNAKVWDLFHQAEDVRDMIATKIQEESLRTYLFTYSSVYDSLCLNTLAEMFELNKPVVHSIISKMIINEELMASLDEPTQTVAMHRTEPSRLQSLALQLAEKVSQLVDNNERIMEIKQGNLFYQKNQQGGYQQNQQQWGRRNQRQNRQY